MGRRALRYAGASRPIPGETANGDQWLVNERPDGLRVAIVDGLGHGSEAEAAALAAIDTLRSAPDLGPVDALLRCDQALRGTRGAAASVLTIDRAQGVLLFAGVGNVEGRFRSGDDERHFSPNRGVLGQGVRRPHVLELALVGAWTVLLHSDGIRTRDLPDMELSGSVDELARDMIANHSRDTDDASVVIVRGE